MSDSDYIAMYMDANHAEDEMEARDFYRWVFPKGSLEEKGTLVVDEEGQQEYVYQNEEYKYNAIVVEVTDKKKLVPKKQWDDAAKEWVVPKIWSEEKGKWIDDPDKMQEKTVVYRYTVTDDLDVIDDLQRSKYFCLMSPLTYVGNNRSAENARECYAIVVDLDNIRIKDGWPVGLDNLINQMALEPGTSRYAVPPCSAICASGTGAHIWWILERPIKMYPNYANELQKLKRALTNLIWNNEVVDIKDKRDVQQEGVYQGFRVVGTVTKINTRARVFKTGGKVTIEDLNRYVAPSYQAKISDAGKGKMSWEEAKRKHPEWTEKIEHIRELREQLYELRNKVRAEENLEKKMQLQSSINDIRNEISDLEERKTWPVNRRVYEWWKTQLREDSVFFGHRYWCIAMLAVYARKASYYEGDRIVTDKDGNPVIIMRDVMEYVIDEETGEKAVDPSTGKFIKKKTGDMVPVIDRKTGKPKVKIKKGKNTNPVTFEELEKDAYDLIPFMNGVSPENKFDEDDVLAALEYWNAGWTFYKREYIEYHSGISIPKNELRKGNKQEWHLEDAREKKKRMKGRGQAMKGPEGRPLKKSDQRIAIMEYRHMHPDATPMQCKTDTGISRNTVYRWWNEIPSEEEKIEIEQRVRMQYYDSMMKKEGQ